MPIPVIIWGGVIGGTALVGFIKGRKGISRIKKAKQRYAVRQDSYEAFIKQYEKRHEFTSSQFEDLAKTRLEALTTMGVAVEFLEKAKLKERDLVEKFDITPQLLVKWKRASINAVDVLGGMMSAAASGAATAASAYGLVGLLASASTGTAISTLSGAAAANATLAWLGGGALAAGGGGIAAGAVVFGGLVAGPALFSDGCSYCLEGIQG